MKIAMWSGPRNLSTAMMYSFGNRTDFSAIDEPFYSAYLEHTGLNHPMRDAVIQSGETDPEAVQKALLDTESRQEPHQYQKHMTQHMLPGFPKDWIGQVKNVLLIRHPARVLASWSNKVEEVELTDIGFVQQWEVYEHLQSLGQDPVIIDSHDIRDNPEGALRALCAQLDLPWDPAMLAWEAGPKPYDGVWAAHWYDAVHKSTGFAGKEGPLPDLSSKTQSVMEQALPYYEKLAALKLAF